MSRIEVWKCDQSGKLFEDKNKYQAHLRLLAKQRSIRRRIDVEETEKDAWWNEAYETISTVEQWSQFVIDNQDRFWAEAAGADAHRWSGVGTIVSRRKNAGPMPVPKLVEFTKFNMKWSNCISNSHSCPHNGVKCWSANEAKDGRPRGYPGWHGRVEWLVTWLEEYDGVYLGADLFSGKRCRAHTGPGGGGGLFYSKVHGCHVQRYTYDFKLFAADWPGLAAYQTWIALGGDDQVYA